MENSIRYGSEISLGKYLEIYLFCICFVIIHHTGYKWIRLWTKSWKLLHKEHCLWRRITAIRHISFGESNRIYLIYVKHTQSTDMRNVSIPAVIYSLCWWSYMNNWVIIGSTARACPHIHHHYLSVLKRAWEYIITSLSHRQHIMSGNWHEISSHQMNHWLSFWIDSICKNTNLFYSMINHPSKLFW